MNIRIIVTGSDEVIARLNRINDIRWAGPPAEASLRLLEQKLSQYPPQRAGSKYKRTEILSKGWTVGGGDNTPQRVTRRLGTKVEYAPWVQSKLLQARVHRGRWLTEVDAVEQNRDDIAAIFRAAIERVAR